MTSVVLLAALLLIVPLATHADPIVDTALTVFGALIFAAVWLLGKMILGVILAVIYIAQYNNFINSLLSENPIQDAMQKNTSEIIILPLSSSRCFESGIEGSYSSKSFVDMGFIRK